MSSGKIDVDPHIDWTRPISLMVLILVGIALNWKQQEFGLYVVFALGLVIVGYLVFTEQRRVSSERDQLKHWNDLWNSSTIAKPSAIAELAKKEIIYGAVTREGNPYVARLRYLAEANDYSLELVSLIPKHSENMILRVDERSVNSLVTDLNLRTITSIKNRSAVELVYFTPFSLPPREKTQVDFAEALVVARARNSRGLSRLNSWRTRALPAAIGAFVVVLTSADVFRKQPDLWAVPFWLVGVAFLVFAVRFGIRTKGTKLSYCNGLRKTTWNSSEIESVSIGLSEAFGFRGKGGGCYPIVRQENGLEIHLEGFALSRKDAVQAFLVTENFSSQP